MWMGRKYLAMSKTLFLHIGLQKTGTTTIQNCLTQNRLLLADNGFVFPDPAKTRIGLDDRNHGHLSLCLTGYWRDTPYKLSREEAWGELRDLYFKSDVKILVSHEGLSTPQIIPHLQFISEMLRGVNTKVIIYLRRQDVFAQSVYKERLKANGKYGFQKSYEQGEYRQLLDFRSILQAWQRCVGKDNIVVRLFEKSQMINEDVLDDFLHVTGVEGVPGLELPSRHANPMMSRAVLEISRTLNAMGIMGADVTSFKLWLNDVLMKESPNSSIDDDVISPARRLTILRDYCSGNEGIARDILGRDDGRLFYDALPDEDENWHPYCGIPPEDVARMLAAMFDKYSILNEFGE